MRKYHKDTQVVSIDERGKKTRSTWGQVGNRSRHLASALKSLGVMEGDILGTISPNTINHLELLSAISGCGAVAHTINPRLFPEEIVFIINDAKDKILFVDTAYFLPDRSQTFNPQCRSHVYHWTKEERSCSKEVWF